MHAMAVQHICVHQHTTNSWQIMDLCHKSCGMHLVLPLLKLDRMGA